MEGKWVGKRMIPTISKTHYKTVEGAIKAKSALIEQFETKLGYNRESENPDPLYAYELGILDALKEDYELQHS